MLFKKSLYICSPVHTQGRYATLAQSVEQRIRNAQVESSSLLSGSSGQVRRSRPAFFVYSRPRCRPLFMCRSHLWETLPCVPAHYPFCAPALFACSPPAMCSCTLSILPHLPLSCPAMPSGPPRCRALRPKASSAPPCLGLSASIRATARPPCRPQSRRSPCTQNSPPRMRPLRGR